MAAVTLVLAFPRMALATAPADTSELYLTVHPELPLPLSVVDALYADLDELEDLRDELDEALEDSEDEYDDEHGAEDDDRDDENQDDSEQSSDETSDDLWAQYLTNHGDPSTILASWTYVDPLSEWIPLDVYVSYSGGEYAEVRLDPIASPGLVLDGSELSDKLYLQPGDSYSGRLWVRATADQAYSLTMNATITYRAGFRADADMGSLVTTQMAAKELTPAAQQMDVWRSKYKGFAPYNKASTTTFFSHDPAGWLWLSRGEGMTAIQPVIVDGLVGGDGSPLGPRAMLPLWDGVLFKGSPPEDLVFHSAGSSWLSSFCGVPADQIQSPFPPFCPEVLIPPNPPGSGGTYHTTVHVRGRLMTWVDQNTAWAQNRVGLLQRGDLRPYRGTLEPLPLIKYGLTARFPGSTFPESKNPSSVAPILMTTYTPGNKQEWGSFEVDVDFNGAPESLEFWTNLFGDAPGREGSVAEWKICPENSCDQTPVFSTGPIETIQRADGSYEVDFGDIVVWAPAATTNPGSANFAPLDDETTLAQEYGFLARTLAQYYIRGETDNVPQMLACNDGQWNGCRHDHDEMRVVFPTPIHSCGSTGTDGIWSCTAKGNHIYIMEGDGDSLLVLSHELGHAVAFSAARNITKLTANYNRDVLQTSQSSHCDFCPEHLSASTQEGWGDFWSGVIWFLPDRTKPRILRYNLDLTAPLQTVGSAIQRKPNDEGVSVDYDTINEGTLNVAISPRPCVLAFVRPDDWGLDILNGIFQTTTLVGMDGPTVDGFAAATLESTAARAFWDLYDVDPYFQFVPGFGSSGENCGLRNDLDGDGYVGCYDNECWDLQACMDREYLFGGGLPIIQNPATDPNTESPPVYIDSAQLSLGQMVDMWDDLGGAGTGHWSGAEHPNVRDLLEVSGWIDDPDAFSAVANNCFIDGVP